MDALGFQLTNNRFQLIAELAEGSMATVFKARDIELKRDVAIKFLHRENLNEPRHFQRFRREALFLSRLQHPHLVQIFSVGKDENGTPFIVTEYVDGVPLSALLREHGRLDWRRAVSLACQICNVMNFVHSQGIAHRDLKPSNVLIVSDPDDFVKVIDFGLAISSEPAGARGELTVTGQIPGTSGYVPPELWESGGAISHSRGDIYSLGCILYETIAGKRPFSEGSSLLQLYKHISQDAPVMTENIAVDVPSALDAVIAKALARDPENRYETMSAFALALQQTLEISSDSACADTFKKNIPRLDQRGWAVVVIALLAVAVVAFQEQLSLFVLQYGGSSIFADECNEQQQKHVTKLLASGQIHSACQYYNTMRWPANSGMEQAAFELKLAEAMVQEGYADKGIKLACDAWNRTVSSCKRDSHLSQAFTNNLTTCYDLFREARYLPDDKLFVSLMMQRVMSTEQCSQVTLSRYRLLKRLRGERDGKTLETMQNLAMYNHWLGRNEDGLNWSKRMISLGDAPSTVACRCMEGEIYMAMGNKSLARRDFEETIVICRQLQLTPHGAIETPMKGYLLTALLNLCILELDSTQGDSCQKQVYSLLKQASDIHWVPVCQQYNLSCEKELLRKLPPSFIKERQLTDALISLPCETSATDEQPL